MNARYYTLRQADLPALFDRARGDYDVIAKRRDANGNLCYGPATSFADVDFTAEQPRLSAKACAFPQIEELTRYRREGRTFTDATPAAPARPALLFGVNMCDAAAFEILDKVFSWDYKDDPYLERRARTTLFALACDALQIDCFCDRLDFPTAAVDLIAYRRGDDYLVEVRTEKGAALAEKYAACFGPAPAAEATGPGATSPPAAKKPPLLEEARPQLSRSFDHEDWALLAGTCVGCGTCTYLCPTCHCFDIQDEGGPAEGRRLRVWDHCTGRTFTQMPAHQPRDRQFQRYRQRLLHKFWYYPERFGPILCTGCGRCITFCPVKINIRELVEYFGGLKATPPGGARRK